MNQILSCRISKFIGNIAIRYPAFEKQDFHSRYVVAKKSLISPDIPMIGLAPTDYFGLFGSHPVAYSYLHIRHNLYM